MAQVKNISLVEVEYTAHKFASAWMEWGEPIPDFSSRFPNILESTLAVPFHTFRRRSAYSGLQAKAAVLFYVMVKNHPFQNGNKRIAVVTLLYFLYKNDKWLKVDNQEFYNFAKWVAESNAGVKDATIQAIKKFINDHLIDASSL